MLTIVIYILLYVASNTGAINWLSAVFLMLLWFALGIYATNVKETRLERLEKRIFDRDESIYRFEALLMSMEAQRIIDEMNWNDGQYTAFEYLASLTTGQALLTSSNPAALYVWKTDTGGVYFSTSEALAITGTVVIHQPSKDNAPVISTFNDFYKDYFSDPA